MAVPNLAPNYLNEVRRIRAEREEADKQRAFEAAEATKEFGRSLGRSAVETLLKTGADIAGKAFDNYQSEPFELAKEGAYIPDSMVRKQAIGGLAKAVLGDGFKSGDAKPPSGLLSGVGSADVEPPGEIVPASARPAEPETGWPIRRGGEKTPYKPSRTFKPPAVNTPAIPDAEAPTFKAGLPDPEGAGARATPGSDRWGVKPPPEAPKPTPEAPDTDPIETVPVEAPQAAPAVRAPDTSFDASKAFRSVAAARNRNFDRPELSSRERGLYEASQANLAMKKSDAAYKDALSGAKGPDPKADMELRKLQLETEKLETAAEAAKRAQTVGTPEYEARRTKAWNDAFRAVATTEQRAGGSAGLLTASGSANRPRAMGLVVDDGNGWPRIVAPDADKRFIYRGADGVQIEYTPKYDKDLRAWTATNARRITDTGEAPFEVPSAAEAVKPRVRPVTYEMDQSERAKVRKDNRKIATIPAAKPTQTDPARPPAPLGYDARVRAIGLDPATATAKQIKDRGSDTQLALLPRQDRVARRNEANELAAEAEKRAKDASAAATAAKDQAELGRRVAARQEKLPGARAEMTAALGTYSRADDLVTTAAKKLAQKFLSEGDYGISGVDDVLDAKDGAAALRGEPNPYGSDEPGLSRVYDTLLRVRREVEATELPMVEADAVAKAQGYVNMWANSQPKAPTGDVVQQAEKAAGIKFPPAVRAKLTVPTYAPGPSEQSPGQLPPPGQSSAAEDLFRKINAMPWSADRKRRVFLATAKERGIV